MGRYISAQESMDITASYSNYFFRAPSPLLLIIFIIIISIVTGIIYLSNASVPPYTSVEKFLYDSIVSYGIIVFAIPALLAGVTSPFIAGALEGLLYFRRSILMAFISLIIILGVVIIAWLIGRVQPLYMCGVILFAYAATAGFRHLVLITTSNPSHIRCVPVTLCQPLFGIIALYFVAKLKYIDLLLAIGFSTIFVLATCTMLSIITMPIIRNFGISMPLELFKYTLAQFTEKKTASTQQLERFLDKIGETVNIHVGVICFKKKRKEAAKDKINMLKSVVVVPALHPGPFGYVGGGNLPTKLMRELNHIAEHVLVAHGSATHDLNPTTGKECNKIAHEIKRMIADTKYSATCSKFIRVPGDEGCNICAQYFGDAVILVYTSAPYPTDDVEYSIGMNARLIAKTQARDAIFIDAHNCLDRKTGDVLFGSRKSFELLQLIEHACKRAGQASVMSIGLRIGIAQSKKFKHEQGLGEQGIQVLVVETGGSQRVAYILYDGNNMVPNLREKILHSVKGLVDDAEVLTTDNHVVNLTIGGYNPVGMKIRSELLIATTRELVQLAIDDLEDVEVGINSKIISNIRVLGNQNTIRLTTTINAMLSILLKTFIICETLAVLGCWAFYLTLTGW